MNRQPWQLTMNTSKSLKIACWANAIVAETSALLALLGHATWTFVNEITGGYWLFFGLDMALLAGLAAWAALRKTVSKPLLWAVVLLNSFMIGFFLVVFDTSATRSPLGTALLLIDVVTLLACLLIQVGSLRNESNVPTTA
ncbi:hypothetical protein A6C57_05655 [Fibrella sp. ES10-3-2-2]